MKTKRKRNQDPAILTAVWNELMRLAETGEFDEQIVHGLCVVLYLHGRAAGSERNPDKYLKTS